MTTPNYSHYSGVAIRKSDGTEVCVIDPNGNILASAGATGRIFEIEKATKRVVWDYRSPFGVPVEGWSSVLVNDIYTAHRYPEEYAPLLQ